MSTLRLILLLPAAAAVLTAASGCSILRREHGSLVPNHTNLMPGKTHYRDVLHQSGPPSGMSSTGEGLAFLYEHAALTEYQIGLSIEYKWFRFFKFTIGHGNVQREAAVMLFDRDGLLRSHRTEQWKDDIGGGAAVQFLISMVSVIDTSEYDSDINQNAWGAQLLEGRLPVLLNARNSLENGQSGLEQLGTPSGAGQRAMELQRD